MKTRHKDKNVGKRGAPPAVVEELGVWQLTIARLKR